MNQIEIEEKYNENVTYKIDVIRDVSSRGRAIVNWVVVNATNDIIPQNGKVIFENGQNKSIIYLTIIGDSIAEDNETFMFSISVETVSNATGGSLGNPNRINLVILANDSPYGSVGWSVMTVDVEERDIDYTLDLSLYIIGNRLSRLKVSVRFIDLGAVSNITFASNEDLIILQHFVLVELNDQSASIKISILKDVIPELVEARYIEISSIEIIGSINISLLPPNIINSRRIIRINIQENDFPYGQLEFDQLKPPLTYIRCYEEQKYVLAPVVRNKGSHGDVKLIWQSIEQQAKSPDDYNPRSGIIYFTPAQTTSHINVTIVDDIVEEELELFELVLISIESKAVLGMRTSIMIGISPSDSIYGTFQFRNTEYSAKEPRASETGPFNVTLQIDRVGGSKGDVLLFWQLDPICTSHFQPITLFQILFKENTTTMPLLLSVMQNNQLNGRRLCSVALIIPGSHGLVSSIKGSTMINIEPDPESGGTIAFVEPREYVMSEPVDSLNGTIGRYHIQLSRSPGIYGNITVKWLLLPRDTATFLVNEGLTRFADASNLTFIEISVVEDDLPELPMKYNLILSEVDSSLAKISNQLNQVTILVTASDYPYGIFQFTTNKIDVQEEVGEISLNIRRYNGQKGTVTLSVISKSGSAESNSDFMALVTQVTFMENEGTKEIIIRILDDKVAERPEYFTVVINSIKLMNVVINKSIDMEPIIGPTNPVTVNIMANDNAWGEVNFNDAVVRFHENVGQVRLQIRRGPGTYGNISVILSLLPGTATLFLDFILPSSLVVTFTDNESMSHIEIALIDDSIMEFEESFQLIIISTSDGTIGKLNKCLVIIEKSDYPNGLFSIIDHNNQYNIPNVKQELIYPVSIARTAGNMGAQIVTMKINGPNSMTEVVKDINDIGFLIGSNSYSTDLNLNWSDNEIGMQNITVVVRARPDDAFEIGKNYYVTINSITNTDLRGAAEINPSSRQLLVSVAKFGQPNGVVQLVNSTRSVIGDEGDSMEFVISRSLGFIGAIEITWMIINEDNSLAVNDFELAQDTVVIQNGGLRNSIIVKVVKDKVPELTKSYQLTLINVTGGADLDSTKMKVGITIRENDFPYGLFQILSTDQYFQLINDDLDRQIQIRCRRINGLNNDVNVVMAIKTNYSNPANYNPAVLIDKSVTLQMQRGDNIVQYTLLLPRSQYIGSDYRIYVMLTNLDMIQSGFSLHPEIDQSNSLIILNLPDYFLDSYVGFSATTATVDDRTLVAPLKVHRIGSFGVIDVTLGLGKDGSISFPDGFREGMINMIQVADMKIRMIQNQSDYDILVKIYPINSNNQSELFMVNIRSVASISSTQPHVNANGKSTIIEPYGVVYFATINLEVEEFTNNSFVTLILSRKFSCYGNIIVYLTTQDGTAKAGQDYESKKEAVVMETNVCSKTTTIRIFNDNEDEETEEFYVTLTTNTLVTGDKNDSSSPRPAIGGDKATVKILQNGDVYGVIYMVYQDGGKEEGSIVEGSHGNITIITQGIKGPLMVLLRTVGGGEPWQTADTLSNTYILPQMKSQLSNITKLNTPISNMDYQPINMEIYINQSNTNIRHTIFTKLDTLTELDEYFFVYITFPNSNAETKYPRLGSGLARDNGMQSFLKIKIESNGLYNGVVRVKPESASITVSEDVSLLYNIELERLDYMESLVKINWMASISLSGNPIENQILKSDELMNMNGSFTCSDKCSFQIQLKDDEVSEDRRYYYVILTYAGPNARIDPFNYYVNVTSLPSDDPFSIGFLPDSRQVVTIAPSEVTKSIPLLIGRNLSLSNNAKSVSVRVRTHSMVQDRLPHESLASTQVYKAVNKDDYEELVTSITFLPNEVSKTINIIIKSTNHHERMLQFYVILYDIEAENIVSKIYRQSTITIVPDSAAALLTLSQKGNHITLLNFTQTLLTIVTSPSSLSLDNLQNDLMVDLLTSGIQKLERLKILKFPDEANNLASIFCKLIQPNRNDAVKGDWRYLMLLELMVHKLTPSDGCNNVLISWSQCTGLIDVHLGFAQKSSLRFLINAKSRTFDMTLPFVWNGDSECTSASLLTITSDTFIAGSQYDVVAQKLVSVAVNGISGIIDEPVKYTLTSDDKSGVNGRAKCAVWTNGTWRPELCQSTMDHYGNRTSILCSCKHMSIYGAYVTTKSSDIIGYHIIFYIVESISIAVHCMAILSLCHNQYRNTMFSKLWVAYLTSGISVRILHMIDPSITPYRLLSQSLPTTNNVPCVLMSLALYICILTWIFWPLIYSAALFRVFVNNCEHLSGEVIRYLTLGCVVPLVWTLISIGSVYGIYTHVAGLGVPVLFVVGDVNDLGLICFIRESIVTIICIIIPVVLAFLWKLIFSIILARKKSDWGLYDDLYRNSENSKEYVYLVLFEFTNDFILIGAGLLMFYGTIWALALFLVLELLEVILLIGCFIIRRFIHFDKLEILQNQPNAYRVSSYYEDKMRHNESQYYGQFVNNAIDPYETLDIISRKSVNQIGESRIFPNDHDHDHDFSVSRTGSGGSIITVSSASSVSDMKRGFGLQSYSHRSMRNNNNNFTRDIINDDNGDAGSSLDSITMDHELQTDDGSNQINSDQRNISESKI